MREQATFSPRDITMTKEFTNVVSIALARFTQALTPWTCRHQNGFSEIIAYSQKNGKTYVIAQTFDAFSIEAEANAELIVSAANKNAKAKDLLISALNALELCLNSGGLSWEAEQEAECLCSKIRQSGLLQ